MTLYEDERAFWDDIAGKYILKHSGADQNITKYIDAATTYADRMVIARRKRKIERLPDSDIPQRSASVASLVAANAV
ncbi:hypothetical protein [Pseudomonas triticicola]|uniref:hypothetical protein n=1 Tax=Pseudomonas triticicola TaxID=2842345 RepID=UPI003EB7C7D4